MNEVLLRVEQLERFYPNGSVHALNGIDFQVRQGEFLAIMGTSGSGKSTLFNLLGGLDQPDSGRIFYRGQDLQTHPNLNQYRAKSIGFVFQSFHLIPTLTAIENVQIPMFESTFKHRNDRLQRAQELLEAVGLIDRLHQFPNRLSVGERQRVSIARALANEPEMLLADEPTGNLDLQSTAEILQLFANLRKEFGLTLLMITHSLEVAAHADRILELRGGKIVQETQPQPTLQVS